MIYSNQALGCELKEEDNPFPSPVDNNIDVPFYKFNKSKSQLSHVIDLEQNLYEAERVVIYLESNAINWFHFVNQFISMNMGCFMARESCIKEINSIP